MSKSAKLGKATAETVCYCLEKIYSLKLEDVAEEPEVFSEAIESMCKQFEEEERDSDV